MSAALGGCADRPALGERATELATDPAAGRTSPRLLFSMIVTGADHDIPHVDAALIRKYATDLRAPKLI